MITCVDVGICVHNLRKFSHDIDSSGVCHELSLRQFLRISATEHCLRSFAGTMFT